MSRHARLSLFLFCRARLPPSRRVGKHAHQTLSPPHAGKGEDPWSVFSILINGLGSMAKAWNYEGEQLLRSCKDVDYTIVRLQTAAPRAQHCPECKWQSPSARRSQPAVACRHLYRRSGNQPSLKLTRSRGAHCLLSEPSAPLVAQVRPGVMGRVETLEPDSLALADNGRDLKVHRGTHATRKQGVGEAQRGRRQGASAAQLENQTALVWEGHDSGRCACWAQTRRSPTRHATGPGVLHHPRRGGHPVRLRSRLPKRRPHHPLRDDRTGGGGRLLLGPPALPCATRRATVSDRPPRRAHAGSAHRGSRGTGPPRIGDGAPAASDPSSGRVVGLRRMKRPRA